MMPREIRLYRLEDLAFGIIRERSSWHFDDASIGNNVSPSPSPIQQVLRGRLRR